MTKDTQKTAVIFRMWPKKQGGECLALFPYDICGNHMCTSYQHTGQHSGADYDHCVSVTRPATSAEYAGLKAELETLGYDLRVIKRADRRKVDKARAAFRAFCHTL